jgi:miniconductance mechanosensitive channel
MSDLIQQLFETLQLDVAEETSEAVGTGLSFTVVILVALAAYILTRFILLRILVRFYARTKSKAGEILLEKKVFHRLTLLVPAIVIYLLAPLTLEGYAQPLSLLNRLLGTYAIIIIIPTINAALNALNIYYETLEVSKTFPITSIIQVLKVVAFVIVGIIAAWFLFEIPAVYVLAAIGAMAAAGTVVFNDLIMAFLSGMLLTSKRMIAIGDWIEVPEFGIDGQVLEITLTTVSVKNWDNTFATVPSKYLLTHSYRNWRGVEVTGARRIKRAVYIDMHTIRRCTDEMLDAFSSMPYLADHVRQKRQELAESDPDGFITNLGLFRAYVRGYLQHHPKILPDTPLRVYQEEPTRHGLPIQVLAFCSETEITSFEEIQSDIFDHILTMVPEFELNLRQAL